MKSALDKLDGSELNGRRIKLIEDRKRRRYVNAQHCNSYSICLLSSNKEL